MALTPEQIEYLKSEEGRAELLSNNLITNEKTEITEEAVAAFLEKNTDYKKKIVNTAVTSYLGEKLGIKENTEELLDKPLILASETEKYKRIAVGNALAGVKYSDLILSKIDMEQIKFGDNKLEGLEEQLNNLKAVYPDLFIADPTNKRTPPPLPKDEPRGEIDKVRDRIEELKKQRMTNAVRSELMQLELKLAKLEK